MRRQLSRSHFKQLIYIPDDLKRAFYAEMCRIEGWSTRALAVGADHVGKMCLGPENRELVRDIAGWSSHPKPERRVVFAGLRFVRSRDQKSSVQGLQSPTEHKDPKVISVEPG